MIAKNEWVFLYVCAWFAKFTPTPQRTECQSYFFVSYVVADTCVPIITIVCTPTDRSPDQGDPPPSLPGGRPQRDQVLPQLLDKNKRGRAGLAQCGCVCTECKKPICIKDKTCYYLRS